MSASLGPPCFLSLCRSCVCVWVGGYLDALLYIPTVLSARAGVVLELCSQRFSSLSSKGSSYACAERDNVPITLVAQYQAFHLPFDYFPRCMSSCANRDEQPRFCVSLGAPSRPQLICTYGAPACQRLSVQRLASPYPHIL